MDIWSLGCVFAEILIGKPLFPGKDIQSQLILIFKKCGYPNFEEWPQKIEPANFKKEFFPNTSEYKRQIKDILAQGNYKDPLLIDLIDQMLILDPNRRLTATEALSHPFFKSLPEP